MFGQMKAVAQAVLVVAALGATAAMADEEKGTRVEIRLASGTEVDPEKLVQAIAPLGNQRLEVKVIRKKIDGADQLTIDMWGTTIPASEIPNTLREAFPQLASATITVGVSPDSAKSAIKEDLCEHDCEHDSGLDAGHNVVRKRIIKKEVVKEQ